jgi:hypothetical protein
MKDVTVRVWLTLAALVVLILALVQWKLPS